MFITYKPGRKTGYLGLLTLEDGEKFWVNEDTGAVEKYSPILSLANVKSTTDGLPDLEKLIDKLSEMSAPYECLMEATQNLYDAFCRSMNGDEIPMNDMHDLAVSFSDAVASFAPASEEEIWKDLCELGKDIDRALTCFLVEKCINWRCKDE